MRTLFDDNPFDQSSAEIDADDETWGTDIPIASIFPIYIDMI